MYKKSFFIILIANIVLISSGCSHKITFRDSQTILDGEYDSEFPRVPVSRELESISNAVKLISIDSFYESYSFSYESQTTEETLSGHLLRGFYDEKAVFKKPAAGTATVIYHVHGKIVLLTCAHILEFPDTVITYYQDVNGQKSRYIKNAAVKLVQTNSVHDLPYEKDINEFRVLALDSPMDMALIGVDLKEKPRFPIKVFNYPRGAAKELNWANFVYLIGYPRGKKMISSAVISRPRHDRFHSFLIDASLPRGISGGPIMAIRDGVPNFELVGMATSFPAESRLYLSPGKDTSLSEFDTQSPYQGDIYVTPHIDIIYGITNAVSIESIMEFIMLHKNRLALEGYLVELFFKGM